MSTAIPATRPEWQAELPAAARLGILALVVAVLAPAWWGATRASREAVQHAGAAISGGAAYAALPDAQLICRRDTPARSHAS